MNESTMKSCLKDGAYQHRQPTKTTNLPVDFGKKTGGKKWVE